jgi:hypothetical protein
MQLPEWSIFVSSALSYSALLASVISPQFFLSIIMQKRKREKKKDLPFEGLDRIDLRNQLGHPIQNLLNHNTIVELCNHQMLEVPHGR